MTPDLDLSFDPELERRLRAMAGGYEPEVPARIRRYAADVAHERTAGIGDGDLVMQRVKRPALVPRPSRAAVALAAAVLVVAVGAAGLVALRPYAKTGPVTGSASPPAPAQWGGLRWRDVTATAIPASWVSSETPMSVVFWHGTYYANPATILFSSTDGATWHRVEGAPEAITMAATNDLLVLESLGCTTALNYTSDGQTWKPMDPPPGEACITAVAATDSAIVAVKTEASPVSPLWVSVPYRSTDGATWTRSEVPADMAVAPQIGVAGGRTGFLAAGLVPDMSSIKENDQGGYSWSGDCAFWYSPDGSSWQETAKPDGVSCGVPRLQRGSLGDWLEAHGRGYHSVDDLTWIQDSEPASMAGASLKVSSDGSRILAQATGPTFYVSLGDGTWRQLVNASDVDGMPDGGLSWVLPAGVLYIADGHVFFGTPTQG